MARNLSWIDPDKLASLLDVVSPAPRRVAGEDPSEGFIDSALFAATFTNESIREPAAKPAQNKPAARPAAAAPATRPAAAEPPEAAPFRRGPAPAPAPAGSASAAVARPAPTPAASVPAEAARPAPAPAASVPAEAARPAPAVAPGASPAAPETAFGAASATPAPRPPALVAFQPDPRADLAVRLEAFLDWVVSATRSQGAIITDAHGLVVVERRANQVEACMTASVDLMLNHVADVVQSDLDGYVTFHRNGLHLVTLWTPSEYGRFFGVLIGETAPPQESIALAGQGFRTLFAN
jgi:hypothetical protein